MKILIASVFGLFLVATSFAQTEADTLKVFRSAADNNLKILQILKQERLNCCDYRNEPRCNEIMKPTKEKGGIEVIQSVFPTDGSSVFVVPFAYKDKPEGISLTADALMYGKHFEIIDRDIVTEGGKVLWVGKDKTKYEAAFSRTKLSTADSNRPKEVTATPSVCYLQSLLPDMAELVGQDRAKGIWCIDAGVASKLRLGGTEVCVKDIKCGTEAMMGATLDYGAACKLIVVNREWDCPPATYCAGDKAVLFSDGKVKLSGQEGFETMNMKDPINEKQRSPILVK